MSGGNVAGPELTVYYDGACPLCSTEIGHYRRCRGAEAVEFVDIAAAPAPETAVDLGPGLSRDAALGRFHVRDSAGRLHSGAAGFARLWRVLPGWRWLGRVAGSRFVLPLAEAAYRAFLPIRPRLSRAFGRWRARVPGR